VELAATDAVRHSIASTTAYAADSGDSAS